MPLIDDILPTIASGYALVQSLGVTKHSVRIVRRTWDSGEVGLGTPADTTLDITPNPEKKETASGLRMGPIIPAHVGGGYTVDQLQPSDAANEEFWYEVSLDGQEPEKYALVGVDDSESFQYFVDLASLTTAGPE